MKLVIEVSDIAYEAIMHEKENTPKDMDSFELLIALATPLAQLGEELRTVQKGINNANMLLGFNMAVAICNKYLGEGKEKE